MKIFIASMVQSSWRTKGALLLLGALFASSSQASTHHVVESGETLSDLAVRYEVSQTALIDANGLEVSDLKIGQVLGIPDKNSTHNMYKVKMGDSLSSVAQKYNIDINELASLNKISPQSGLLIDSMLIMPTPKASTTASATNTPTTVRAAATKANKQADNNTAKMIAVSDTVTTQPTTPAKPAAASTSRPKSSTQNSNQHRVEYGETLSKIADRYKVDVQSLAKANNISVTDTLYFGRYLTIPTTNSAAGKTNSKVTAKSMPAPRSYTVRRGDTLMGIANRFNTNFMEIAKLTGISPYDALEIGQTLTLPANATIAATDGTY